MARLRRFASRQVDATCLECDKPRTRSTVSEPALLEEETRQRPLPAASDEARGAGRGGIAVAGAKVWFILVGVVQQTVLPRIIGMEGYGAFSTVLAISNIPNNVVTTSSIQDV